MSREFTQQEQNELYQAEQQLRQAGLDVDHEHSQDNAHVILDHFDKNPQTPITVANVIAAVNSLSKQLHWKFAVRVQADTLVSQLEPSEVTALRNWLQRQKLVSIDEDQQKGYHNIAAIVGWIKAHNFTVDSKHLDMSVLNVMKTSTLYWQPEPRRKTTLLHDHSKDVLEQPKSDRRNYTADGRIKHSYSESERVTTPAHSVDAWEKICHDLTKNGTHSQQAQLVQVLNNARSRGLQWRQVHEQLQTAKRQFENKVNVR